jgi:hypothetical protein
MSWKKRFGSLDNLMIIYKKSLVKKQGFFYGFCLGDVL